MPTCSKRIQRLAVPEEDRPLVFLHNQLRAQFDIRRTTLGYAMNQLGTGLIKILYDFYSHSLAPCSVAGSARRFRYRNAPVCVVDVEGLASSSQCAFGGCSNYPLLYLDPESRIQVYRTGHRAGLQISVHIGFKHEPDASVEGFECRRLPFAELIEHRANAAIGGFGARRPVDVIQVDVAVR